MIPRLNQSGGLPPFLSQSSPTDPAKTAPYRASLVEIVQMFGGTAERKAIMNGFLDLRERMKVAGIVDGFQWVNGSFIEDCEKIYNRSPRDIDVVTFAHRPTQCSAASDWQSFVNANPAIFDRHIVKANYKCDAFFIDFSIPPEMLVSRSRYWFGLFSHQRVTFLWKGLLEVSLVADDAAARQLLNGASANAS